MNTTYSINSLTKEEVKNILEALLFSSSVDVCADWFKEDSLLSLETAAKIRKMFPEITLENIYVYDPDNKKTSFNDEHTTELVKIFPDVRKEYKETE